MPIPTKFSPPSDGPRRRGLSMRRRPSQARAQLTFSTVLEAAVGIIEREGVERATTRRIAFAAGVSIGAVYEYFPNKESIVLYLGTSWLCRIRDVVDALHPCRSGISDLLGYVNRMLDDVGCLYRGQPGVRAVVRLIGAIPELREAEEFHDAAVIDSVTSALKHFASDADLAELRAAASYMVLISHSVLSECLVVQTGDADRMLRMLRMSIYALISPFLLPKQGSGGGTMTPIGGSQFTGSQFS